MSVLTVSDMVSTNLLIELNLNPVWEKYRGYLLGGTIVTSLYPFYMTLNGVDPHCVPINDSTTWENQSLNCTDIADRKLSGSQTAYINSHCATDEKLWFQRYAGAIMLGIAIGILIVSSFWLHLKNVKDGIITFSDARKKFLELDLSKEEILILCSKPLKGIESDNFFPERALKDWKEEMNKAGYSPKAHKTIREVIRLFAYNKPDNSIFTWYLIRNILLILYMLAFVCLLICNMTHTEGWSEDFTCRMNERSGIAFKEFICTSNYAEITFVYLGVYCGTVTCQLLLTVCAICICYKCADICDFIKAPCVRKCNRSPSLLTKFWENASPNQSGLFKHIVAYIHSSKFKDELATNMKSICGNEDHELIRVKSKLFGDTSEVIPALNDFFLEYRRIKMSIHAVKSAQYSMNENVCQIIKNFILEMREKKMVSNELIVNMFKNSDDADGNHSSGVKECIKLHDIEDISRSVHTRSILYYAFSKEGLSGPHKFAAAKALCQGKDESALSIHEMPSNTTKTLKKYLEEIYREDKKVEKILKKCGITLSCTSRNQQGIRSVHPSDPSQYTNGYDTTRLNILVDYCQWNQMN